MVTKKKAATGETSEPETVIAPVVAPVAEAPAEAAEEVKAEEAPKDAKAPKAKKAAKSVPVRAAKVSPAPKAAKSAAKAPKAKPAKAVVQKKDKPAKPAKPAKETASSVKSKPGKENKPAVEGKPVAAKTATVLDSQVVYEGKLFRVLRDHIIEPGGIESYKDVIKHNGSVVILAVDPGKSKKDPWIVIERQYRHAAGQFLWELPAGKLDGGEKPLDGAKRELAEETGYGAKKWTPLVEYFASPGFLGEAMKVFLAEGLIAGDAHPEEDEKIDFRLVKLSEVLSMVDKGKIIDGKTLTSVLLYARKLGLKRKK
jgi:ADP-ribose pyrophosphatase